jgi:hypothetical protein
MTTSVPTQPGTEERITLKPSYRTAEFWGTAVVTIAPWLLESLPPAWKAALSVAAQGIFAISRGLAKLGIGRR